MRGARVWRSGRQRCKLERRAGPDSFPAMAYKRPGGPEFIPVLDNGALLKARSFSFREDVIWLAGLMEGEGHFSRWQMRVQLRMTDRDVVDRAYQIFGGIGKMWDVKQRPDWQRNFGFILTGHRAAGWMMILYPFLGQRKRWEIRTSLNHWRQLEVDHKIRGQCPKGHPYTQRRIPKNWRRCAECDRQEQRLRYGRYGRRSVNNPVLPHLFVHGIVD
jgi:hypothetical protein